MMDLVRKFCAEKLQRREDRRAQRQKRNTKRMAESMARENSMLAARHEAICWSELLELLGLLT